MRTVLVIDDDDATRGLTARYLSRGGYRVITADSVRGALSLLRLETVALIVLDLHLPEITGWEALKILKNDSALNIVPVIVVSSTALPDAEDQVASLGARGFIGNPITEERILAAVKNILGPEAAHA